MTSADPFDKLRAETAYLFRHALLRDAAYSLQLPADRAALHALALELLETHFRSAIDQPGWDGKQRWPLDPVALELAEHVEAALAGERAEGPLLLRLRRYLYRAARHAFEDNRFEDSYRLWLRFAHENSGFTRLEGLRLAARSAGFMGRTQEQRSLLEQASESEVPRNRGIALLDLCALLLDGKERERAGELLQQAERLIQGAGHGDAELVAQAMRSRLLAGEGKHGDAAVLLEAACVLARTRGDKDHLNALLGLLGGRYLNLGKMEEAERCHRQSLELCQACNDRYGEAVELGNFAEVLRLTGRSLEASEYCSRALRFFAQIGDRHHEAHFAYTMANIYRETGRAKQAEELLEMVLAIHRETGDRMRQSWAISGLASLLRARGDHAAAEAMYLRALELQEGLEGTDHHSGTLSNLAALYDETGRLSQARELYQQVLARYARTGARQRMSVVKGNLGWVSLLSGDPAAAKPHYREALALDREFGDRRHEAIHLCGEALALMQSDGAPAAAQWRQAWAQLKALGDTGEAERLQREMRQICQLSGVFPLDQVPDSPKANAKRRGLQ